jgi:phosphoglycerate dehydrogenase-like enzyme
MEPIQVLITMPFEASLIETLHNISPQLLITHKIAATPDELGDAITDTHILYAWKAVPHPRDAPNLRWIQFHNAGIDGLLEHPIFNESDIALTTASGIHAIQIAEYTFSQILAFAHHLPEMFEDKLAAQWPEHRWDRYEPSELYGSTLGIIGYGSIGRQIARIAQAFGMKILALKRDLRHLESEEPTLEPNTGDPDGSTPDRIYPPEALHSMLAECDFAVLTVPLTPATQQMIDQAALRHMKSTGVLINVSRGPVIDESALVEALQNGIIGGAGLDVFAEEPLPEDSPLWKLPNVILSPHIAGFSPHYDRRVINLFAENLHRFLAGEPLLNQVSRSLHY